LGLGVAFEPEVFKNLPVLFQNSISAGGIFGGVCVFVFFGIETNLKGKTTGRLGPAVVLGFAKRNAFRRGEIVEFNLHGNYEWQTGHSSEGNSTGFNSYSYGGDLSLRVPKLFLPLVKQHKLYRPPTSIIKMSSDIVNRAGYFKRHIVSGELTFNWQTSVKSSFEFSPLIVQFDYMAKSTQKFKDIVRW